MTSVHGVHNGEQLLHLFRGHPHWFFWVGGRHAVPGLKPRAAGHKVCAQALQSISLTGPELYNWFFQHTRRSSLGSRLRCRNRSLKRNSGFGDPLSLPPVNPSLLLDLFCVVCMPDSMHYLCRPPNPEITLVTIMLQAPKPVCMHTQTCTHMCTHIVAPGPRRSIYRPVKEPSTGPLLSQMPLHSGTTPFTLPIILIPCICPKL